MTKKKILAALTAGAFVMGIVPAFAANSTNVTKDKAAVVIAKDKAPANNNGQQPPEAPKDKDGKPLPPPDSGKQSTNKDKAQQPPEAPKDKDGKPLPPPDNNNQQNGQNKNDNHQRPGNAK